MGWVVDVVHHDQRNYVYAYHKTQQDVQKSSSIKQFLVVSVLPEEVYFKADDGHCDWRGSGWNAGGLDDCCEEVTVDKGDKDGE